VAPVGNGDPQVLLAERSLLFSPHVRPDREVVPQRGPWRHDLGPEGDRPRRRRELGPI